MKTLILLIAVVLITGCPSTKSIHTNGREASSSSWRNPLGKPTYVVYVKGLVCPSCAVGLKKALIKLPFVRSIHVNYNTGVTLIYETHGRIDHKGIRKFDESRIRKAIEQGGYKVGEFKENK